MSNLTPDGLVNGGGPPTRHMRNGSISMNRRVSGHRRGGSLDIIIHEAKGTVTMTKKAFDEMLGQSEAFKRMVRDSDGSGGIGSSE